MLIGNAFLEFGDLLYAVGRIEYGIKKGRIANVEARVPNREEMWLTSMFKRHPAERETKENSMMKKNRQELFSFITNQVFFVPAISSGKGSRH